MWVKRTISGCLMFFLVATLFFSAKVSAKFEPASLSSYTAPITLYWLAKSGVPEAVEYSRYIDAEKLLKPKNIPHYERVERVNKIYQEIRYDSLNTFVESENYSNVMDLGCGVSPRFLYMAEKKINYVGTDLEDVANLLNVYAPNFLKDDAKQYVRFVIADAANRKEMLDASKGLKGKICIVEEGLLMYLSREQQKALLENIRDILKKNGGCFVTSDFVAGKMFREIAKTIYGDEDAVIIGKETKKIYENLSQILFNETMFKSEEEAVAFIESAGLKVEKLPIFSTTPDLISIRDLNNRDIENMHALLKKKLLWVITVADKK